MSINMQTTVQTITVLLIITQTSLCAAAPSTMPLPLMKKCGTSSYYFPEQMGSFYKAMAHCHLHGMELVTIQSAEEQECLVKHINDLEMDNVNFWTSANDLDKTNTYVWMGTGQRLRARDYSNWMPNEPSDNASENCVGLGHKQNFQWNNFNCANTFSYICEK